MSDSIQSALADVPSPLHEDVLDAWSQYTDACERLGLPVFDVAGRMPELARVWACSELVSKACARDPALPARLHDSGLLDNKRGGAGCRERLRERLAVLGEKADENQLGLLLRRFRREEMVRIAWRDLAGTAALAETLEDLSELADVCVDEALNVLDGWQRGEWGVPRDAQGKEQRMVVLGMGKLGARELNFSSDIDLIFAFDEDGQVDGPREKTNGEYFVRLGQRLIKALDTHTAEGFVFRVDMRLRPYGESGPLVMNFDGLETYYQSVGREWERYAMIKARPMAGDLGAGVRLMEMLRPFVYRRYLDFGAFDSLREMKAMIARQVERKGLHEDIKLGPGGIREIEFIGQAFQLIRGGQEAALRQRGIVAVLNVLRDLDYLPGFVVTQLLDAYRFLRRAENRIQAFADQQTQALPTSDIERQRLAFSMGYGSWDAFKVELNHHRDNVQSHFSHAVLAPQSDDQSAPEGPDLVAVWQGLLGETESADALHGAGFEDGAEIHRRLLGFRKSRLYSARSRQGQERIDRLMPLLLRAAGARDNADECAIRLFEVVEKVAGRSVYIALLVENPMALGQLVRLAGASPWIATHLSRHPVLLDELLDPRSLYAPLPKDDLAAELSLRLDRVVPGEMEDEMYAMRQFKQAAVLRVAAADVTGAKTLMKVSDSLTWIAEVCLDEVLRLAWRDMTARFGRPGAVFEGESYKPGFAIVGYGKMGGIELGYSSDLDLVFLHDSRGEQQQTDGDKCIDNATFFARLGQRVMHYLNTMTAEGMLYEVDMRLRPSGNSGLLVTSIWAFEEYQKTKAWTWEHQALIRA
ncbi:MAG: bifunctional [glutamate--ammonia ligase]-adenylyl-L-tyrosine phosphorylase/[glutamate--ammonia-ligase] adenylyltransferase, partial [Gammaproteobacteria bacterium]